MLPWKKAAKKYPLFPDTEPLTFFEGGPAVRDCWPKPAFLTDEQYKAAIDSLPLVCSDTIAICTRTKSFWLAKRRKHSAMGPWMFGGRWKKGETARDAAVRTLKRETSLVIPPERLSFVTNVVGFWKYRNLEPQESGDHDILFCYCIEFSDQEIALAQNNLDAEEYDVEHGLRRYTAAELEPLASTRPLLYYHRKVFG